ncbi:MAG: hypothetical protein MOGMAGMI_01338 [Candidatus Omnitrophica bacterium]|nr:hypothetical protein [Candidatus Omnitrophota bacterium]
MRIGRETVTLGAVGEGLAAHYLQARGYEILTRNYTCALGEIDLVARDGDCLVFVEVKTRRTELKGLPAEAVTPHKQRQVLRVARAYLQGLRSAGEANCRFDVVSVLWRSGEEPVVELIRDAFGER